MKKVLLLFTALLTVTLVSAQFTDGDYSYVVSDVDNNEVHITATTATGDITLPQIAMDPAASFIPYTVTGVDGGMIAGITNVTVPSGYKVFADNSFRGLADVVTITFNSGEEFGVKMMRGLPNLTTVVFPDNTITVPGGQIFYECGALTSVTLGAWPDINNRMFYRCNAFTELTCPATVTDFSENSWLSSQVVSLIMEGSTPPVIQEVVYDVDGTTVLNAGWKGNAANMTAYVNAADMATYQAAPVWMDMNIQDVANYGNVVVVGDTFVDGDFTYTVSNIDPGAEEVSCGQIVSAPKTSGAKETAGVGDITIPGSVTSGGVVYTVTAIAANGFKDNTVLTSVVLPASVTLINGGAFQGATNLAAINLENVVTFSGYNTLFDCPNITTANMTAATDLGLFMFHSAGGTSALSTINIPSAVNLPKAAFRNTGISSIDIPASVETIGDAVFMDCVNLTEIQVNWTDALSIPVITPNDGLGAGTFSGLTPASITLYVPAGTAALYGAADVWTEFTIVEGTLSVKSIEALNVSVYPNPTNGVVFVNTKNHNAVDLTVFDLNGRSLLSVKGNQVDMTNLSQGIYILKGKTEKGTFAQRIVKK